MTGPVTAGRDGIEAGNGYLVRSRAVVVRLVGDGGGRSPRTPEKNKFTIDALVQVDGVSRRRL